jgi:shikimate 5-dehydrogenase
MWSGDGHARQLGELNSSLDVSAGTVVNATTLGWNNGDSFPVERAIPGRFHFFDLNYNPGWLWRNRLRDRGIRVATGECMLARQAAESFRIWTGTEVGEEVVAGVMAELLSPEVRG